MWFRRWVGLAASLGATAAVLVALPHAGFQVDSPGTSLEPAVFEQLVGGEADSEPAAASSGGPQEGVQVHGSWTIEVRDPDGTTVSYHEFENALTTFGRDALNKILSRTHTFGRWAVVVGELNTLDLAGPQPGAPCLDAGNPRSCFIEEPDRVNTGGHVFKPLTVTVPSSGANANKLVLQGTATAARAASITKVETVSLLCAGGTTFTPAGCGDAAGEITEFPTFTSRTLNSAVPVVAGQSILVTVAISFA